MIRRLAVLFQRFGPYHVARLEAAGRLAAERGAELVGFEVAARDAVYDWDPVAGAHAFRRRTLLGVPYEQAPARAVRAAVRGALDEADPDVVALPGWGFAEARAGLAWCRSRGRGAVLMSESSRDDFPRRPWREWLKRRLVRRFGAALVGGRRHADYAVDLGVPRDRVFDGYDAVDNEHFAAGAARARADAAAQRARLGLPARYILCCCRFVEKKNVGRLLEAVARLAGSGGAEGWSLVLSGDGPLRGALEARAAQPDLTGRVTFAGFVQYPDLPAVYGLAEAFVLPSATEQWGLVVNEAMAAGLPVVVSARCGCAPDLVGEGENGYTFDPGDAGRLAELLGRLIGDAAARASMGRASARRIADWGPARFADGLWRAAACAAAVREDGA